MTRIQENSQPFAKQSMIVREHSLVLVVTVLPAVAVLGTEYSNKRSFFSN